MKRTLILIGLTGLILLSGANDAAPPVPKSPKATDAIRMYNASVRQAVSAYWITCEAADQKLAIALHTAADAAHDRNDGTEEQACLEALKDVNARIDVEVAARIKGSPPAAIDQLRCEKKDTHAKGAATKGSDKNAGSSTRPGK